MVEESADEMDDNADDDTARVASTFAPSTAASTKSLSPPIFKSNAFANANLNGSKNRSISPPPVLPKSRAQVEEEHRKERELQEKMEEYEDKIEAMKERIAELQDELKTVKEELRLERTKTPPLAPVPAINERRLRVIEDGNVSRFQNSIDDLLAAARRDDSEVLDLMTEVVKATRAITDDLKRFGNPTVEDDPKVRKLTTRLSATANNLITATKSHVSSQGLSPVSLVDAAASHLTSTVVDLVKVVKMRPGSGTTFRSEDDAHSDHSRYSETPLTSPLASTSPPRSTGKSNIPIPLSLGSRSNLVRTALRDEVYAPRSPESPRSVDSRRSSSRNAYSKEEEELRLYLDTQTQAIVESIQSLLTRIRNPKLDSLEDFR